MKLSTSATFARTRGERYEVEGGARAEEEEELLLLSRVRAAVESARVDGGGGIVEGRRDREKRGIREIGW